ncbi:MAG TPA: sigma-70 family RNA polymerase sigma factor, partial [Arthrobacter sp.]|nr:sigma-70 family RNA polymerase sigma factor [Arthrobacter sp.]
AMAALRDNERDILQLAYWDELSMAEIAGVLQCSEAAAKVRLHRARAAFRKQMALTAPSAKQNPGKQKPPRKNSATQKMGA